MPSVSLIAAECALGACSSDMDSEPAPSLPWDILTGKGSTTTSSASGCPPLTKRLQVFAPSHINNVGSTKMLVQARNGQRIKWSYLVSWSLPIHLPKMLVVNNHWLSFSPIYASCRRTMHRRHRDYTSYPSSIRIGAYTPTHHHVGSPLDLSLFCGFHQGGHSLVLHVMSLCAGSWVCDRRLGRGLSEMPSHASAPLPQNCKMYFTLEFDPFSAVQLQAIVLG